MLPTDNNLRISLENINYGTFKNLRPVGLLRQLANCHESTCLQVLSNRVSWSIYLEQGSIIYATNSVEPLDRLERHLRRLAMQIPTLPSEVYLQLRLMFAENFHSQIIEHREYQGIHWLIEQQYFSIEEAALLIQEMVKETIESFLLIQHGSYELTNQLHTIPKICGLNVTKIIKHCQERLQLWRLMETKISSPYQRPYLCHTIPSTTINLIDELDVTHWMKGFSIRHLAVISNRDELELAGNIYPYVVRGEIILHEPDPPFDKLPKIVADQPETKSVFIDPENYPMTNSTPLVIKAEKKQLVEIPQVSEPEQPEPQSITTVGNSDSDHDLITPLELDRQKVHTIVSVDDSPIILQQISHFLKDDIFSVVTINEPVKAPISIIRYRPDLILLDLNMAEMDGYELCRLIRNNSMFKNTPIVMVTANKGIINRVKAKMSGASGFFPKPFSRVDLLKMVFTYLT
ncbi:MAG: response regulator [Calothrix sp. MO_167.B12]|nr:response regulator [Calothrix sp. MO_167.B12]